jgi:outer membrane protein TolC
MAVTIAAFLSASGPRLFASGQQQQPPTPAPPPTAQPRIDASAAPTTLRISADEAVRMSVENNLGLKADRLGPQIETYGVAEARAAYSPSLISLTTTRSSTSPSSTFQSGADSTLTNESFRTNGGVAQLVPWGGGRYSVTLEGSRLTTSDASSRYNPQLDSTLVASYTQPLLRNLTIDTTRQNVLQSVKRQEIADVQLRQALTQNTRLVRNAYFDLVNAIGQLEVAQKSYELAQTALKNNRRRVEVGTMANIEIVQAEAEVAGTEEQVIVAEGQIKSAEDRLRVFIMNPSQPDYWTTKIEPSERPTLTPQPIDVDAAVRNALANRTDIAQVRKQLEQTDISTKYLQNQKLPALDVTGNYNLAGTAGTLRQFDYSTGVPIILSETNRAFGGALRDVFGNDFKTWSVQVNLSYPLGTSQAGAALAQSRLQREQQETNLHDLEMQIVASVRDAARQVETSLKRVATTQKARELAEQSLAAEEKRLAVGLSDTYRLFQAQRDLTRQLNNELNAIIAYNRALIAFEAVQTAPLF